MQRRYVRRQIADGGIHGAPGPLLMLANPNVINAVINPDISFSFTKDLAPIGGIASDPTILVVNPSLPVKSVPELIDYLKAHPGTINMASGGVGSTPHLAGELFKMITGTNMLHVPYRGDAPAVTDMLAGQYTALAAVAITFIWSMLGTNIIIFLTGMATLDQTLIEAARVDGLSRWQIFSRVTVPLLKRFIQFSFVITVISAFSALFSLIFVMTNGGPGFGTTTLEFFVYQTAFAQGQFGTGALYGMILFVIMIIVGLVQLRLIRSEDGEGW